MEEVNIPYGVNRIGVGAFSMNLSLKKIDIPNSVTIIDIASFKYAPLDSIVIPENVTYIGREAFYYNENLQKVYSLPTVPPATGDVANFCPNLPFKISSKNATLYVPKGSLEAYRESEVFAIY